MSRPENWGLFQERNVLGSIILVRNTHVSIVGTITTKTSQVLDLKIRCSTVSLRLFVFSIPRQRLLYTQASRTYKLHQAPLTRFNAGTSDWGSFSTSLVFQHNLLCYLRDSHRNCATVWGEMALYGDPLPCRPVKGSFVRRDVFWATDRTLIPMPLWLRPALPHLQNRASQTLPSLSFLQA